MKVLEILGVGKEKAMSRAALCYYTGLPDRSVRQEIADARNAGVPIVNNGDGSGYYIASDIHEVRTVIAANASRIKALSAVNAALLRTLNRFDDEEGTLWMN